MFSPDSAIATIDPELAAAMESERLRQENSIELIASENFAPPAVLQAQGSVLTNKYAEGYPGRRYYGGCQFVDQAEELARSRARELFGAGFANVQPHSGSQANAAVYHALLKPGDAILGMNIAQGGHLTHGAKVSASGQLYDAVGYGLRESDEDIDYDQAADLAKRHKPKLVVCGASAFSRKINFAKFREIADSVGAVLMADIAHYAGLVAAKVYPSPVGHAHIITTTTHKTLRGPRGGMIMGDAEFEKKINSAVFPAMQGGPLMHAVAAKAVAFKEATTPEFADYQKQVVANARAIAETLADGGARIVSGGTDCHMFLCDLRGLGVDGKTAEAALDRAHITLNKNAIPNDPLPPMVTSGIRIGTPASTTRGFDADDFRQTGEWILRVLKSPDDEKVLSETADAVRALCAAKPIYAAERGA